MPWIRTYFHLATLRLCNSSMVREGALALRCFGEHVFTVTTLVPYTLTLPSLPLPSAPSLLFPHPCIDILLELSDFDKDLQNSISLLCEKCWSKDIEGKSDLVPNTLICLVARSLSPGAKVARILLQLLHHSKLHSVSLTHTHMHTIYTMHSHTQLVDVKRVWSMRQAFLLLDFDDPSADVMKTMLLSCCAHPLYLRWDQGRKLVSFMFGLHPAFVGDLHLSIKKVIPYCSR